MKIKKIKYTDKGYSYIECTKKDCLNWGGMSICDYCGRFMNTHVYLIFVLGQAYCPDCFREWLKRSEKYEEDLKLQEQNHERWYKAHGFKII